VLRVVHAWTFPYSATRYSILPLIDEGFNEELKKTAVSLIDTDDDTHTARVAKPPRDAIRVAPDPSCGKRAARSCP
jgi:hypothetical protein